MSITAVPLRPMKKRVIASLWLGVGALLVGGIGLAFYGTNAQVAVAGARTPAEMLAANAKRAGVSQTASGLQYSILRAATGPKPTAADIVVVEYEGRFLDGTVFDSSVQNGGPVPMQVGAVIPGFTEALMLMSPGAKYRFWLPSELAYGERGAGNGAIPPNTPLIFDVSLLAIAPPQAAGAAPGGR